MRPNSQKKRTNQKGAVVVTAVAVLIIMSILMTATVSYVSVNRKKTNDNYCHKQAYLTASTTLKGIVKQIEMATGQPAADGVNGEAKTAEEQIANINTIKALAAANGGQGTPCDVKYNGEIETDYKIGTTKIVISQEDGSEDNLVVTAYTTYAGVTEKVAAHISMSALKQPARFTNTIEQIGTQNMTLNNLKVVGDTAVLDKGELDKHYKLVNNVYCHGSLYIWGHVGVETINTDFKLGPNILDSSRGSFVQISEDFTGYLVARSTVKKGDGFGYVYVGGTMCASTVKLGCANNGTKTGEGYQVDLITCGVDSAGGGNNWNQYGNVYCYNKDEKLGLLSRNGDFKISNHQNVNIEGDVFIEGDLIIDDSTLTIDGDLHVAGSITGDDHLVVTGNKYLGKSAKIEKSNGRGAKPKMEYSSQDYKYYPEDFFMNRDGKSSATFKQNYEALSKGTNNKDMFRDFGTYTVGDGPEDNDTEKVTCNFHVTENCKIDLYPDNEFDANLNTDAIKNSKGVKASCQRIVLVDVTDDSGDIMIMLKNGVKLDRDTEIIVRNRSTKKLTKLADGTEEMEHQYNCYFVSDSGTNFSADGEDPETGIKKHKYDTEPGGYFGYDSLCVYDYDCYVRMFESNYYTGKDGEGYATRSGLNNTQCKDTFVFNPTHDSSITTVRDKNDEIVAGAEVYCPGSSNIIFLIGENFSFGPKYNPETHTFYNGSYGNCNRSFIQATVYAPEGYFVIETQLFEKMKVVDATGHLYNTEGAPVLGCGVFIAKVIQSKENSYFYYTEPAGSCVLSGAKGNRESEISGFELDRYDHY